MSLAAINSQYAGLNGLAGYGTNAFMGAYGTTGLYSDAYVENAKTSIQNGYEVNAMSNSYSNKASVSSSSFAQQCQTIGYLLQNGRTDDAMKQYNALYEDMAANPYYQGYTENEIKTLLQDKYMEATGTTIVNDISTKSTSAFNAGALSSVPIVGFLLNTNSKDDFIAQATGTEKSNLSKVKTGLGVAATTVGSGLAAAGMLAVKSKGLKDCLSSLTNNGILNSISKACKGKGKFAAIGAAALAIGTFVVGKIAKSKND